MTSIRTHTPPLATLVGVGDELLYGETVDTNGSWLARELSELGFLVRGRLIVGDDLREIGGGVRRSLETGAVVVVTGGLGPTPDDMTREAVSDLLELELKPDPRVLAPIRERFRARGIDPMPANARSMALVPEGATVLDNALGAAPGLVLETEEGLCILLPGVPREMRQIFRDGVAPFLAHRLGDALRPVAHRVLHTAGIPESVLSESITASLRNEMGPVAVAFLPDVRGVRLRLTARDAPDEEVARKLLDRAEASLKPILAPYRFEAPEGELTRAVGEALLSSRRHLATAESCTGGLIAKRLTDQPGASEYFLGGVVAYANEVKSEVLGVGEDLLACEGAVCAEVAEAMALGVARALGAEAGVGVTGVAGPGGGTAEKPVGTVHYAVAVDGDVSSRRERFSGDREMVRERSAQAALFLLLKELTKP